MPTNVNGMNRYMYVDGNPVSYRDPSGHVSGAGLMHMVNRIIGHAIGKDFGPHGLDKRLSTSGISKGVNRFSKRAFSAPSKVGTKEAWKQAVVVGLQTNWDLEAMAQGYFYGHRAAKEHRKEQIETGGGTLLMVDGTFQFVVGIIATIAGHEYIGPFLVGTGISTFQKGNDMYHHKNPEKIVTCGYEAGNPICFYVSSSPSPD
ncbi:hypothetical protein LEP1GSC062_2812 [Leptospira alexanderi serovar Manhao 3 str. L 60]|uniref:RHS repeat-associated core domain protein n=2 Tax=Leptospira alexanderi TaxID=100053 RepID=V6IF94_9LEPT|nr:hypothetical protein LEP1GSC062_2812 [Leptospira alexanderi serovar Manhao 3 str. L 60]